MHARGVELDHALFVGEPAVADRHVLGIELLDLDAFDPRVERVGAPGHQARPPGLTPRIPLVDDTAANRAARDRITAVLERGLDLRAATAAAKPPPGTIGGKTGRSRRPRRLKSAPECGRRWRPVNLPSPSRGNEERVRSPLQTRSSVTFGRNFLPGHRGPPRRDGRHDGADVRPLRAPDAAAPRGGPAVRSRPCRNHPAGVHGDLLGDRPARGGDPERVRQRVLAVVADLRRVFRPDRGTMRQGRSPGLGAR